MPYSNEGRSKWLAPLQKRYAELHAETDSSSPRDEADMIIQAPGRTVLIGEHTDHQDYSVCPCAISHSIGMLVKVTTRSRERDQISVTQSDARVGDTLLPLLSLQHLEPETYEPTVFRSPCDLRRRSDSRNHWSNFVLCGYLGVLEYLLNGRHPDLVGRRFVESGVAVDGATAEEGARLEFSPFKYHLYIVAGGDLPAAVGLSSSSAIVVSSALAVLHAIKFKQPEFELPTPSELATLCAHAERYCGVASGGMDQASIILSQPGSALHIDFKPLTTTSFKLPDEIAVVLANSCRASPKATNADKMYNMRVFELKAACMALLNSSAVVPNLSDQEVLDLTLRQVVRDYLKISIEEALALLPSVIGTAPYDRTQMLALMGKHKRDLILNARCGQGVWDNNELFYPFLRARHVLSEELRVREFVKLAQAPTPAVAGDGKSSFTALEMGRLVNECGLSLAHDFECSTPEIDELCGLALKYGALGARAVGAGWGGCVGILVPHSRVPSLIDGLLNDYYLPIYKGWKRPEPPLEMLPKSSSLLRENTIFAVKPAQGAFVRFI